MATSWQDHAPFPNAPMPGQPGSTPTAPSTPYPAPQPSYPGGGPPSFPGGPPPNQTKIPGAPGTANSDFGTTFKPWDSIDSTYSQDQWKKWEANRDPACPPNTPYRGERKYEDGSPVGCVEKPVDCPPGSYALDSKGVGYCRKGNAPAGAGGGGGGKGGGGGMGGGPMGGSLGALFGPGSPGFDTEQLINSELKKVIEGHTRFGPETMAQLAGGAKAVEQARIARETEAARENQISRGVLTSPLGAALETDIREQAAGEYDQAIRTQQVQKAVTDFEDHMQALGNAQQWLNSLRSYALGLDSNNVQREGIAANVMIAREGIAAEMDRLMMTIGANKDILNSQMDFNKWMFYNQQILCANLGQC